MSHIPTQIDEAVAAAVRLWAQGHQAEALAKTNELVLSHPDDEQVLLAHTGLLLHKKAFEATKNLLKPLHEKGQLSPSLLANLSIAFRGCGECDLAINVAKELVKVAPEKPSGWNALGLALMEQEQYEEAENALAKGLEHHPDHPALKHHLHQVQEKLNKPRTHQRWNPTGDLLLHAQSFSKEGNPVSAEAALRQAIEFDPSFFGSHGSLGTFLMRYGRTDEALPYLEKAHALNPECATTKHFLALARGDQTPDPSPAYIEELFDGYAERFDEHLIKDLAYVVPQVLSEKLLDHLPTPSVSNVLDLGCGTGLVGVHIGGQVNALDGVDLSQKMLDQAASREVYRNLIRDDVSEFLNKASQTWHGIIAADVFIYCGDIEDIVVLCYQHLEPGGVLVFSVESCGGDHFLADPATGRYQHSSPYLERILAQHFVGVELIDQVLRQNSGEPVQGQLVVARRAV